MKKTNPAPSSRNAPQLNGFILCPCPILSRKHGQGRKPNLLGECNNSRTCLAYECLSRALFSKKPSPYPRFTCVITHIILITFFTVVFLPFSLLRI